MGRIRDGDEDLLARRWKIGAQIAWGVVMSELQVKRTSTFGRGEDWWTDIRRAYESTHSHDWGILGVLSLS